MSQGRIPLCVPYWDEKDALKAGAQYSRMHGFYVAEDAWLDDVWEWLPLRWKYPEQPPLMPEMLPPTTWEENIRLQIPPDRWDALRKHCYAAAGHRCEICGARGKPHIECHEKWGFDDVWHVQKLEGLLGLCPLCHKAHHLGYARRLGMHDAVLAHIKAINRWDDHQLKVAMDWCQAELERRSPFAWTVDLSWLQNSGYRLVYALNGDRFD